MSAVQIIILAAGDGTRMKSDTPKVLHPLCGRPMIAYALDLAASAGVKQPIVILGKAAEQVKPILPKEARAVIQPKPLGTGDAVALAKRVLGGFSGDVVILYADTPLVRRMTIQRLIETHRRAGATCTLLTTHLADPTGYGRVIRDATGVVTGVVEEAEANATQRAIREVNVGPICMKAHAMFEALVQVKPASATKEWYLTQAVGLLAQQPGTKFSTARLDNVMEALGVNSRVELAKAVGIIRQRIMDAHLQNGVTIVDPHATYIDHGVTIGQDTVIHPGTVIESGVHIGKRCSIGPFARLRAGVAIGDETRVGNFAELVRTKVGARVRIHHVSYLGDATIEDEVNIGAGTITANFDGKEKHATVIGKGAFIGSDTVLVSPVKVGPGAVTGAGSVIPKGHDVPPRGIVVGVPAHPLAGGSSKPAEKAADKRDGHNGVAKPAARTPVRKAVVRRAAKPAPRRAARPPRRPGRSARRQAKRPVRRKR